MLKILNMLMPFFEDCYRRIGVREYAKIIGVSPPTASKILENFGKDGLLRMEKERGYMLYHADNGNQDFMDLSRMYWRHSLSPLIDRLERGVLEPYIILFGSLSKAEAKKDSDVDIAVLGEKKAIDVSAIERKVGRKIHIFWFKSWESLKGNDIENSIRLGYVLR